MSWQERIAPKAASELAREAIPLLEAAIKERFGITVHMGIELEFSVIPSERVRRHYRGNNPLRMPHDKDDQTPSVRRDKGDKVKLFGRSQAICYGYRELGSRSEWNSHKYELVFSHETGRDLQFLADEVTDTKLILQGKPPRHSDYNRLTPQLRHAFPQDYITQVLFDPTIPYLPHYINDIPQPKIPNTMLYGETTHGLHVSFSVTNPNSDFKQLKILNRAFDKSLRNGVYKVMCEGILALDSAGSSNRRISPDNHRQYINREDIYSWENRRIENRLADSQADPHIAVMLNLVGIYHALDKMQLDPATGMQARTYTPKGGSAPLPIYRHEQQAAFASERIIRKCLDAVDPQQQLGSQFHHAIMSEKAVHMVQSR